jgi:transmembrane sensor
VAVAPTSAPNILPAKPAPEVTLLSAGERLRIRQHSRGTVDTPSIERLTGWMRGQLIFDHTPLSDAIKELNRYSTTQIFVPSPDVGHIPVSGTFRMSDSVSFARAAAETYRLRLARHGNEIILQPIPDIRSPRE